MNKFNTLPLKLVQYNGTTLNQESSVNNLLLNDDEVFTEIDSNAYYVFSHA